MSAILEETGLRSEIRLADISAGDQFKPAFPVISPNNRMLAIVDHERTGGGEPVSVLESGAILVCLAEKTGRFLPMDVRRRELALEWLFWQVGCLGPMAGKNHHFVHYAPEKIAYAINRYVNETNRLYGVLDRQLAGQDYIATEYSIADMARNSWIVPHERQQQNLDGFPSLKGWLERVREHPATVRAYQKGKLYMNRPAMTEESKMILFGQTAGSLKR